jgi:hypothetical protein
MPITRCQSRNFLSRLEKNMKDEADKHGIPYIPRIEKEKQSISDLLDHHRPLRHCSYCHQIGHSRNSCPHELSEGLICLEKKKLCVSDGVDCYNCICDPCKLYRELNNFCMTCGDCGISEDKVNDGTIKSYLTYCGHITPREGMRSLQFKPRCKGCQTCYDDYEPSSDEESSDEESSDEESQSLSTETTLSSGERQQTQSSTNPVSIQDITEEELNTEKDGLTSDEILARELQKKEIQKTKINIQNNTRTTVHIYNFNYEYGDWSYKTWIDSEDKETINSFKGDVQYLIMNHDYGKHFVIPDIHKDHIVKSFIIKESTEDELSFILENNEGSDIDHWKEATFKTSFIIKELIRMGAMKNPNYEYILDMYQDIHIPEHTEQDKERAGVTSKFTNISEITGINEPS